MMDFMDSLKRGVDRAGFEVDRLLRVNRVRSRIGTVRSQADEELRQIGRQVMELYDRNELVPEQVRARCEQLRRLEAEIAQLELELEGINSEVPPDVESGPLGSAIPSCWNCGHLVSSGARFCANCGVSLVDRAEKSASTPPDLATAETPSAPAGSGNLTDPESSPSAPSPPAG